jgi:hypothetical protein
MDRYTQIGFSQRVRLEWFEHAARLASAGNAPVEIEAALQDVLSDKLSVGGMAERGNREKAISILLKIWVRPPKDIEPLRDDGLKLLQDLPKAQHVAVHWGLSMAVYPFWGAVAETTGRLLRLQGTAAASQVQRRVKESYGERETVARAARRVLRSFHDWGVLDETGNKGVYEAATPIAISVPRTIAWMMEAFLRSKPEGRAPPKAIVDSPALFPFRFELSGGATALQNGRLDVTRHGLDEEIVMLRPF